MEKRQTELQRRRSLDREKDSVLAAVAASDVSSSSTNQRKSNAQSSHAPRHRRHSMLCIDFDAGSRSRKTKRGAVSDPYAAFSKEQVAECKELFMLFDKNNDRTIDRIEFGQMMRMMGISFTEHELNTFFGKTDRDGDGNIQFEELLDCLKNIARPLTMEEEMAEAFKFFGGKDGETISKHDLAAVMQQMGEDISAEECADMLYAITGGDRLDFNMFDHLVGREARKGPTAVAPAAQASSHTLRSHITLPGIQANRLRTTSEPRLVNGSPSQPNLTGGVSNQPTMTTSASQPILTRSRTETCPG